MKGILSRALLEKTPIEIIYMSQNGILTQRFIEVIEINEATIKAFCLLRGKKRTFKIESILSAAVPRKRGNVKHAN
ncbi:hypothetical protein ACLM5H_17175 [Fredinandcohnia humi]